MTVQLRETAWQKSTSACQVRCSRKYVEVVQNAFLKIYTDMNVKAQAPYRLDFKVALGILKGTSKMHVWKANRALSDCKRISSPSSWTSSCKQRSIVNRFGTIAGCTELSNGCSAQEKESQDVKLRRKRRFARLGATENKWKKQWRGK